MSRIFGRRNCTWEDLWEDLKIQRRPAGVTLSDRRGPCQTASCHSGIFHPRRIRARLGLSHFGTGWF